MPVPCEVSVTRRFNLGNYEALEIQLKAFLGESDDPKQAMAKLEEEILKYYQSRTPQKMAEQVGSAKPLKTMEEVKKAFSEDLVELLKFEEKEDAIIITPRQFLGTENFAKVADAVRSLSGDYISAGKSSHFRVPK